MCCEKDKFTLENFKNKNGCNFMKGWKRIYKSGTPAVIESKLKYRMGWNHALTMAGKRKQSYRYEPNSIETGIHVFTYKPSNMRSKKTMVIPVYFYADEVYAISPEKRSKWDYLRRRSMLVKDKRQQLVVNRVYIYQNDFEKGSGKKRKCK